GGRAVHAHDRVGGVRRGVLEPDDRGQDGAGARAQHDRVRADALLGPVGAGDDQLLRADEPRGAAQQGEVLIVLVIAAVLLTTGAERVDAPEDAIADRGPVHALERLGEPEASGIGRSRGDLGRVHEHLRGDAAEVQAGPAEDAIGAHAAVDLHDGAVCEVGAGERVRRAGADEGDVVMLSVGHPPRLVRGALSHRPSVGPIDHPSGGRGEEGGGRISPRSTSRPSPGERMSETRRPADAHDLIRVRGARENNLRDLSLDLPKRRLTVFTGVSGSGKSSLVFGTIAAESQRMINETYSAFVQGFMPQLARPDVDELQGLTTAIIVDQERMGANVRSTVGTVTDANAYLRTLFSKLAEPHVGGPGAFSFNVPSVTASGAMTVQKGAKTIAEKATYSRVGGMCPR